MGAGRRAGAVRLAGLAPEPLGLRAARWALVTAETVLADPAYMSVFDGGGWAGNCRRYGDLDIAHESYRPVLPPGAEQLLERHDVDLAALGELALGEDLSEYRLPTGELDIDLDREGQGTLVALLDWVLAAATRPAADEWDWKSGPISGSWNAQRALDSPAGVLDLHVHRDANGSSYTVQVISGELGEGEYTCVSESQSGPLRHRRRAPGPARGDRSRRQHAAPARQPQGPTPPARAGPGHRAADHRRRHPRRVRRPGAELHRLRRGPDPPVGPGP
ncbi:hypothetical protein [Actinacidiphila oryziradicis]|uniref:Uncharacterized protein n=1 Tax=Actinacidiphila oryziradicis TaxID=2571141 RepID=A0A4U0SF59_9ACTN|nr:hypothetical protein [Actinacidiphila oryziradicis]TKA06381.1 hypothetical protein FCI23_31845 [Actinacidiphila oryziradicis]